MNLLRDKFGMCGLLLGGLIVLLMLFLQNSGVISITNPVLAVVWWLLAWPFTFTALLVANTATGTQISPSWGIPLLLLSIVVNTVYLYLLGRFVGFIWRRAR